MKTNLFVSLIVILTLCSCSKNYTNLIPEIGTINHPNCDVKVVESNGHYTGNISCKDGVELEYQWTTTPSTSPQTVRELGVKRFNMIEHRKFFKNRLIDPKVYRIFLDSVDILEVRQAQTSDNWLYPCHACAATLKIKFMQEEYLIPSSFPAETFNESIPTIEEIKIQNYYYKYYPIQKEKWAVQISPMKNTYLNKNVFTATCKKGINCPEVLRSIRLNP